MFAMAASLELIGARVGASYAAALEECSRLAARRSLELDSRACRLSSCNCCDSLNCICKSILTARLLVARSESSRVVLHKWHCLGFSSLKVGEKHAGNIGNECHPILRMSPSPYQSPAACELFRRLQFAIVGRRQDLGQEGVEEAAAGGG